MTILEEVVKEKVLAETKQLATKDDLAKGLADVKDKIADTIKWMFIFWMGQIAVLSGIIFAFMKLYFRQ